MGRLYKLTCDDAKKILREFLNGVSAKVLAEYFNVTRLTITRVIKRETYRDCDGINEILPDGYEENEMWSEILRANMFRGAKQRVEVSDDA